MRIAAYNDKQSGWGKQLLQAAAARGHWTQLLELGDEPSKSTYFFARVEQFPPLHQRSKDYALKCSGLLDVTPIIDPREVMHYERKDLQAVDFYDRGMPATYVCRNLQDAESALELLGAPLVSKAAFGSSCSNVRILHTRQAAMAEAKEAFAAGLKSKRGTQRGYVIWQRFLADNPYIYRVVAIGRYRWLFREHNRPGTLLASGSGNYEPVHAVAADSRDAFRAANNFFTEHRTRWCGVDMARDPHTGEWQVLETTLAWGMKNPTSSAGCTVLDTFGSPHPKGYFGRDIWQLLLDELEAGAFA